MRFLAVALVCAFSFSAQALTQEEATALRESMGRGDDAALSRQLAEVLRRGNRPVQVAPPDFDELLVDLEAHLRTETGRSMWGRDVPEFSPMIEHRMQVAAVLALWSRRSSLVRRWPPEHLSRILAMYALSLRRGRALDRTAVRTVVQAAAALPHLEQDLLGFLRYVVADTRWPKAMQAVALRHIARAEHESEGAGFSLRAFRNDSLWGESARSFYRSLAAFATSPIEKEAAAGRRALEGAARYFFPLQFPSIQKGHAIFGAFSVLRERWIAEVQLEDMNPAQVCAVALLQRARR